MEQGKVEKTIYEQSMRYKMPLPEKFKNPPMLRLGEDFFFFAFQRLSTQRLPGGMSISCIPYFAMTKYCRENGVLQDDIDDFVYIISTMDEAYLEFLRNRKPDKDTPEGDKNGRPERPSKVDVDNGGSRRQKRG